MKQSSGSNDQLMVETNGQMSPCNGSRSVTDDIDMATAVVNVNTSGAGRRRHSSSCCNSETLMTSMLPASQEVVGQHQCISELMLLPNDVSNQSQLADYCQQCRCCTAV
jgi:hypothetical protein